MISGPVLLDTGPLVSLLSMRDQNREVCRRQAEELTSGLWSCWPVVTEAAYLLRRTPGAVQGLLERIEAGDIQLLPLTAHDAPGVNAILRRYDDQNFDFADACLMYLVEREGIQHVFTLDRRHFNIFQPSSGKALNLLPAQL